MSERPPLSTLEATPGGDDGAPPATPPPPARDHYGSIVPTWSLVTTKVLEIRRRRGLMITTVVLTVGLPVIVLGLRLIFHAVDPKSYGPAGTPSVFAVLCGVMAEFGFIIAATVGTSAGTTDLSDGVFRHLVTTGRSRLALYLARIPAGLSIVLPLVAVAFTITCLVTSYAGVPQPRSVAVNGVNIPVSLDKAQFESWAVHHVAAIENGLGPKIVRIQGGPLGAGSSSTSRSASSGVPGLTKAQIRQAADRLYVLYTSLEPGALNPPINEMVKIGLWLELEIGIGFMVGLGLGSLIGQRTVSTVLMVILEIVVTPILANVRIPYFLDGQRVVVGVAMDQLRPAWLLSASGGRGGGFGGRGALGIPPMPTWAMITVIVGWLVGWSIIGAWRMMTRDA